MKVKVICRNPQDYIRQTKTDVHRLPRNLDPAVHPLEGAREYVRALNATKLDRVFAKPFVGSLSGHADGVYCMTKHPTKLSVILSGVLCLVAVLISWGNFELKVGGSYKTYYDGRTSTV